MLRSCLTAMSPRRMPVRSRAVLLALPLVALAEACGDELMVAVPPPGPPRGIVVLDGFIQPGLTLLADTGSATTRVPFGPPTEFDGGSFSLERDTVLATSSRGAGNLLYVAALATGTVRRVQLPPNSNPAGARLAVGSGGQATVAVALRDSGTVAVLALGASGAAPTRVRTMAAGTCPTDLVRFDGAWWIVDSNSSCRTTYAVLGDVRLIRIPDAGTSRDTIVLAGLRGSGAQAHLVSDVLYVGAGGDADFSRFPYTLRASGAVAKVDLRNRRVLATRTLPTGSYGGGLEWGLDGALYVSLYQDLASFTNRVVKLRADDLSVVAGGTAPWLSLRSTTGTDVSCGGAVADALGRVHCLQNGTASATSLLVFSPSGAEVRRVAAGQGGVALALR